MVEPIKPGDVWGAKALTIPPEVIDVFNTFIIAAWNGRQSVVKQTEVAYAIASRLEITTDEVYKRHYLDIEGLYKLAGWKVTYDKPAYNESYEATFKFESGK